MFASTLYKVYHFEIQFLPLLNETTRLHYSPNFECSIRIKSLICKIFNLQTINQQKVTGLSLLFSTILGQFLSKKTTLKKHFFGKFGNMQNAVCIYVSFNNALSQITQRITFMSLLRKQKLSFLIPQNIVPSSLKKFYDTYIHNIYHTQFLCKYNTHSHVCVEVFFVDKSSISWKIFIHSQFFTFRT